MPAKALYDKKPASLCHCGDHIWKPISRHYILMVSPEDADVIAKSWTLAERGIISKTFYARGRYEGKMLYLHQVIASRIGGERIDHKLGNGLDNRRSECRLATPLENCANRRSPGSRSGFRGAYRVKNVQGAGWYSRIYRDRKDYYLGTYATPEAASEAYEMASLVHHGDFAWVVRQLGAQRASTSIQLQEIRRSLGNGGA